MRRPHTLYTTFFWHVLSRQIVSCPREKNCPLRKIFLRVSELFLAGLSFSSLWGPCQSCNTVTVRSLSEDVSNKSPSPSSYLFTQPLHVITDLILPFNLHYLSQASVLKHIDFLSITSVHFSCFATIRENWFDQCFV